MTATITQWFIFDVARNTTVAMYEAQVSSILESQPISTTWKDSKGNPTNGQVFDCSSFVFFLVFLRNVLYFCARLMVSCGRISVSWHVYSKHNHCRLRGVCFVWVNRFHEQHVADDIVAPNCVRTSLFVHVFRIFQRTVHPDVNCTVLFKIRTMVLTLW